jgi:hypothetical protein
MRLNTQDRITVGVSVVFALVAAIAGAFALEAQTNLEETEAANGELRASNAILAQEADQLPGLTRELATLEANVDLFVGILPAPEVATVEQLMNTVYNHCERTQVEVPRWSVAKKRNTRKRTRKGARRRAFTELRVTLNLFGRQADLLELINRLEREKALIRVNAFSLLPQSSELVFGGDPVRATLDVSTFRYDAGA